MSEFVDKYQSKDIKQAMLLGLSRTPLPDGNPLSVLSLVAMRGKFTRPHAPVRLADVSAAFASSGRYLSDESRSLLLKFLSVMDVGDGPAVGIFRAIKAHGLKLHPFDYLRLEYYIVQYLVEFGLDERAWVAVVRPARKKDDVYLDNPLTDATLPQAGRAQKLHFIRALRKDDAAKARELIEALLPNEPANVRAELISLLAVDLSDADRAFLEGVVQDRAQSVRDAASALLGGIRGTDAFAKRIDRLKDHLLVKVEGLIRKQQVLKYAGPTPANAGEQGEAQRALLKDLHLHDIAHALGLSEDDLLEAASRSKKIGILPRLLLIQAVKDGLLELATRHIALLDGEDHSVAEFLAETLPSASPDKRDQILRLALRPKSWVSAPAPIVIDQIWKVVGTPLPADLASEFLESPVWAEAAFEPTMNLIAPFIPRALSVRFIEKFESIAPRAALYHRFLLSLPECEK